MSKAEIAKLPKLTISRRSGPPPRKIQVIDLRKGDGAAITVEDAAIVNFFEISYPVALKKSRSGGSGPQNLGLNEVVKGWEVGLPGMKVGGRRELILPPWLVYPRWKTNWGYKPYVTIYVVDLLGIERGGADQNT
jgi:peptidylprolyl isomerase